MAASNINANWTACTHGSNPISEIKSCTINQGGQLTPFSSGIDRYPVKYAALMSSPSVQITSDDVAAVMNLVTGTSASLSITLKDAFGQTGGDILFVCAGAVVEAPSTNGSHAAYASASVGFKLAASDGQTNPISFTRA